jgi:hypothetical protein
MTFSNWFNKNLQTIFIILRNSRDVISKQTTVDADGYYPCYINGETFKIHRIIAYAFIPNDDVINKDVVNHKDGIKTNNALDNLEWVTTAQNNQHAYDTGLNKNGIKIERTDINTNTTRIFNTIKQTADELKTTVRVINNRIEKGTIFEINSNEKYTFKKI